MSSPMQSASSPKKRQMTLDGSDAGDFQPAPKLKRSAKTMVRSKTQGTLAATPAVAKLASPKRSASPRRAAPLGPSVSPAKTVSPAKRSPSKRSLSKTAIAIDDSGDELVAAPKNAAAKVARMASAMSPAKAARRSPAKAKAPAAATSQKPAARKGPVLESDGNETPTKASAPATPGDVPSAAKKFNYHQYLQKKNAVPVALGSKEIPEGAPNCLADLAFLFTGDLSSLTRDTATDLVKRYGGRVVAAPSRKTSFVVVGENPGPSKMEKIKAIGLATIDEDALLDMIRKSNPAGTPMRVDAEEPCDRSPAPASQTEKGKRAGMAGKISAQVEADLWTVKYAPRSSADIVGNPGIYEKLTNWLTGWRPDSKDERAALLSGPPGIGKTTMAQLACRELGYDAIEMNASDTRSKKSLRESAREIIDATSLKGLFSSGRAATKNHVLIMDEVDGMSSGDRGGMAELIMLIKATRIPIICLCNDRASPKVRSLANHCLDLRLRRPDARQIVPRIRAIAEAEGIAIQPNAIEELAASTHADIRQILNLLSTFRLTQGILSYDASKALTIGSAKDVETGPFDATHNLLGGGAWSRMPLNGKLDQYFIDSSLVPLMVHENYMKCRATSAREIVSTQNTRGNFMQLCAAAADSLSLSDGVEALIRGSNQEWSLAPLHGIMSCVRPAYYVHGQMAGRIDFAGWLGQNSRTGKNQRLLTELTKHTFLHTLAGRTELRLDYLSAMAASLVQPMAARGADGIDETIRFMDDYSISREDVDTVLDLTLDPELNTAGFARIPTAVRSAFTRRYNQGVHRLPYSLGGGATVVKRIASDIAAGGAEDDGDDALMAVTPDDGDAAGDDMAKDKNIKVKTGKAAGRKPAAAKKQKQ